MTATLLIPSDPLFLQLLRTISHLLEAVFLQLIRPHPDSLVRGILADLTYSRAELIAENALLRQQLTILQRQVKRPQLTGRDRFWLLLLASRVAHWKQALRIIQQDTLLRWHREGFRLFWKHNTKPKGAKPKVSCETIFLIKQLAQENLLWGAERIRGEL